MTANESINATNAAAATQKICTDIKDRKMQLTYHRNQVINAMLDGNEVEAGKHTNFILDLEFDLLDLQRKMLELRREHVNEMQRRIAR